MEKGIPDPVAHFQKEVDYFKLTNGFSYGLYELIASLIYARAVRLCSKYKAFHEEDDFRKKGPSKESKEEPIVSLGLLLDSSQIPIGMKMYPGNESEKPVLRDVIDQLKTQNNVTGKTIHVADKGLNCAQNIAFSKKSN